VEKNWGDLDIGIIAEKTFEFRIVQIRALGSISQLVNGESRMKPE